jgi:hypothetical protein
MFTSENRNCQNCNSVDSHEFATIQEIRLQDKEGVQITTYVYRK